MQLNEIDKEITTGKIELEEHNVQVKGSDPMPKAKPGRTDHPYRGKLVGSKYNAVKEKQEKKEDVLKAFDPKTARAIMMLKAKYPQADNILSALLADVEKNEKDSGATDLSQDYKMEKLTKAVDILQREINLLKGDKKLKMRKPDFKTSNREFPVEGRGLYSMGGRSGYRGTPTSHDSRTDTLSLPITLPVGSLEKSPKSWWRKILKLSKDNKNTGKPIYEYTISDLKGMGITLTREQRHRLQKISHENSGNITRSDLKKVGIKYGETNMLEAPEEGYDFADVRQKRIAIDTVKNPNKALLGGPSASEAEDILKTKFGYSDNQIAKLKGDDEPQFMASKEQGKLAQAWSNGANNIKSGDIELIRGEDGAHIIQKNSWEIGDFSLDTDSDLWVVNIDGEEGQGTYGSIDDIVKSLGGITEEWYNPLTWGKKPTADDLPGSGTIKSAGKDLENRNKKNKKALDAFKKELGEDAMSAEEIGKYPDLAWTNVNDTQEVKTYLNNMSHKNRVKIEAFRQRVTEPQFQTFLKKYMTDHPDKPYDLVIKEETGISKFNKEDPNNPEVYIDGYGSLMLNQIEDDLVRNFTSLTDMAKKKDWDGIEYQLNQTGVLQAKIEAILNTKEQLQAIRRKGGPKSRGINKESLYDALMGERVLDPFKVIKHKRAYERAADTLHTMLQRKYKENEGNWRHGFGWYVAKIADGFNHVDSDILNKYYLDHYKSAFITETGGVGRVVQGVNTSVDVGPNEIKKQAAKFGNVVNKDGLPKKTFR